MSNGNKRWWALGLIALAQFIVIMDTSIIGVALPRMQADLGFSPENLSWVFNAYVVAFGGLLLLGGRLSDLFGARRMFTAGWLILLVGSAAAGLADGVAVELAARAVQGAGAALIAPSALTLLMTLFGAEPRELTRALALYGAAAPAGGTAGVFLGGVITEYVSWPWVFYINIPIALLAVLATPVLMPSGGARRGSLDVAGALTVTVGLGAAVFAIVRAPEVGWTSSQTWLALAGAVAALVAFVVIQAARREPLMRLSIFRTPNLAAANVAQLLLGAAWIPMWFYLNLYLQQVLGYSAFPSGAALLPMTVLIMVGMIALAPKAINRFGPKPMVVTGLAVLAAGLGWLALIRPDGTFVADVLPASLVAALGMSLAFIPSLGTAISSARPEEGGLASGIVNTSYQVGSALGLAAMTAVAASYGAGQLGDVPALTDGYSAVFIGASVVAAAGAVITGITLRTAAPRPETVAAETPESTDRASAR
ncbi:MFS transporter [Micromonospora peucetia]|uniref:Drug resistance transporter, EmrB/QacA subfamily n=1 Tax=Micromonospora peucetia TaxID=47871 RepID=A0A1C6W4M2_9ACTN|nr:MFS transporter [Micromonospora peucetia]MCX4390091.1 MFS transporter [Micromonospora peucetia]WSA32599.1 MFS transporter [Micromonospora peucetia]SCL73466.1 drug resistance transporter, EmrB/QacA subfamily [Micromonospora peucetia]